MANHAVDRFFDLIKGGKRPADAMAEAGLSDNEIDLVVTIFSEALDGEHFTTSNYDFAIARRLGRLEEQQAEQHEVLIRELRNSAKTSLELIKALNRLVDVQRPNEAGLKLGDRVIQFPTPPAAS